MEIRNAREKQALEAFVPEEPDLNEEKNDRRQSFEKTLSISIEDEREEARVDRFLIRDKTKQKFIDNQKGRNSS